jgi:hypothetical protein
MNAYTKKQITTRIYEKMDSIINRRISELPTDMENLSKANPFGSRLVPDEIWKGSKFERSFVTSFGQGVYEQIAYELAIGSGAEAENQRAETVTLNTWQDERINTLLSTQRGSKTLQSPDWNREIDEIKLLNNPRHVKVETRFDLYIKRDNGQEEYFSLKTVKPNLDQTEIAKRDMLRISAAKPNCKAYLALPSNPDGEGNRYSWSVPKKLFDMNNCPAVLIGSSFWNAVGNDDNTFSELMTLFHEIGIEFQKKIRKEYLDLN